MRQPNQQEFINNAMKVGKRIAITILICIPILIIFAYLTRNIITSNTAQVLIFIAVMGVAVLLEEIIVRKREKAKKEMQIEKKDVFR